MYGKKGRGGYAPGWNYDKPKKKPLDPNKGIRINARAAGSTWWGKQWLEAFNNISEANRLPRGRTYAGNGSVLDIRFAENHIIAKVQGSQAKPYQVDITIPAFSENERQTVARLVGDNPDLLSRLLNRELPPELNEACASEGIRIFPRRWNDLQASCSCPDWAMPCKHLAAILYVVANEIDKNPFLVFDLHRFDLLAALEQAGFAAPQTRQIDATPLAKLRSPLSSFNPTPDPSPTGRGAVELSVEYTTEESAVYSTAPLPVGEGPGVGLKEGQIQPGPALLDTLDFSTIPDCRDTLLTILAEKPAFYPEGDFKAVLKKMYTGVAKYAGKELAGALPSHSGVGVTGAEKTYDRAEIVALTLDADGRFQTALAADSGGNILLETGNLSEFTAWLSALPAGRLANLPAELRGIWLAWRFAESLARHGAFVPQLLAGDDGQLLVRWLPAFLNETGVRLGLLRDLSTLAEFFPALRQLLAGKGKKPLRFDARVFAEVLFKTLPVIGLFGIRMLLPKALSRIIRPQLSLRLDKGPGQVFNNSSISLKQMLAYRWQIAIGDQDLAADAFLEMLKRYAGLVKIRDEYVYFDEKEMKVLAEKLVRPPVFTGPELLQIALSEEYEGARITLSPEIRALMNELLATDLLDLPAGLNATLRPYQHRGYSWLRKNVRLGFGSILADDMGLGKTLQVIATLLGLKEEGLLTPEHRAIAVVPTTLITNWQREVARFAPGLRTAVYHGPARSLKATEDADLVLTSYGVARSDAAKLEKQNWLALVIDEAQNIKNPGTEQSKAVKKIAAPVRIAMSGTPVENRLSEYWSVFDFSNKGYLGSPEKFREKYAIPIEGERDQRAVRRFRKVTQPFVLRRLKTGKTIIDDLTDKVEQNQFFQLTPEQAALYQNVVDTTLKKIENSEGIERRGLVLTLIMALKQICNHPAQYLKKGSPDPALSGKCPLLLDLVQQLLENGEKALIFTQFREMGELLAPMLKERFGFETSFLHGGVGRAARDRMVEDFQTKHSHRLLLLSLKAGGTGLNLTAASQVVHFDLWWNPAVEAQATDRAYRIGQQRNVLVHRFITSATFEERIDAMIQQKKELANLTVTSGETWIGELSDKELRDLFRLG